LLGAQEGLPLAGVPGRHAAGQARQARADDVAEALTEFTRTLPFGVAATDALVGRLAFEAVPGDTIEYLAEIVELSEMGSVVKVTSWLGNATPALSRN
jgi:hypothetical protein